MVIEKDTTYAYAIKHLQNPSFECIRNVAVNFRKGLSDKEQAELYDMLNRGVDLISNEPQMMMYLHSFGLMHQAKLKYAFKHLPQDFFQTNAIEIIDYGCGQAIGEMVYADYLRSHSISQNVKRITLIEPSEICLKRAALHAKLFFPDAEIRTVCKTFDRLTDEDIETDDNSTKLHILSNVLDIESFDLVEFVELIDYSTRGYNQFVCVGPYFNYPDKDERMDNFAEYLGDSISYSECLDKNEFVQNKSWTCNVCIFEKGKVSKPETYTDEQGVVYGNYGKLLKNAPKELTEYTIPNSVTEIGEKAFHWCENLQSITIPDSVTEIGDNAFYWCENLQSITIPDSVTEIGDRAFSGCSSLQSIIIPDSVIQIGKDAFSGCGCLQSILIPDSVTEIGESAFSGCSSLRSINIPDSITKIGDYAFSGCSSLRNIEVDINNKNYCAENDVLFNKDKTIMIRCSTKYKKYAIPDSVSKIAEGAFFGCSSLQSINIPDSVTEIGDRAFVACSSLQSINIPDSVTEIGGNVFWGCSGLTTVKLTKNITKLESCCYEYSVGAYENNGFFSGCSSLQNIIIPDSVTEIGWYAFRNCCSLRSIIIPDSVTEIGGNIFAGCENLTTVKLTKNITKLESYCENEGSSVFIGEDNGFFYDCHCLQSIIIPDSVTEIGDRAFYGCNSLLSIHIPDSVTVIGWDAFASCRSLQSITIPDSVTEIGGCAFDGCSNLRSINIPDSVTDIIWCAFTNCSSLQSIKADINNENYCTENDILFNKNKTILIRCSTKYKEYTIPDSVWEIIDGAFSGCCNLQNINIPDSVTKIGWSAFEGCSNLQSITIPDSVTEIGGCAFDGCSNLQSINIPDSVTKIREDIFKGCSSLQNIKVSNNVNKDVLQSILNEINSDMERLKKLKEQLPAVADEELEKYDDDLPF